MLDQSLLLCPSSNQLSAQGLVVLSEIAVLLKPLFSYLQLKFNRLQSQANVGFSFLMLHRLLLPLSGLLLGVLQTLPQPLVLYVQELGPGGLTRRLLLVRLGQLPQFYYCPPELT